MPTFLADENVPAEVVAAARGAGHDLAWIREIARGADDDAVLAMSVSQQRVLLTFDKDFGEMAFRRGKLATPGIILMRPRLRAPSYVAQFTLTVLAQLLTWEGFFSVAQEGRLRQTPLP
jgi:predicted nuclease of predicted toxin-antitoxin system